MTICRWPGWGKKSGRRQGDGCGGLPTAYDPWLGWEGDATGRWTPNLPQFSLKATLKIPNEFGSNFTDRGLAKTSPGLEMAEHTLENQAAVIFA